MVYLSHFEFPEREREYDFTMFQKRKCYDTYYPFLVLSEHGLRMLDFEPVTILYGGNGSGKTTALNVIAEKLEELFEEYLDAKYSDFRMKSMDDYEQLRKVNMARSKTQSKYVRKNLMDNVREHSNGESAFLYFSEKIQENGLYLLDEPENSLSPERQMELLKFLEDSARFFGCQFIIATHSPFLLSMKGAKIYDMDEEVVDVKRWTELENVRMYYEFFKKHAGEFER